MIGLGQCLSNQWYYSFFTDSHSEFLYLIGWWYFCCQKSSHQFHWVICMSNKIAELPSSAVNISLCFQIIISFREVCISHFQISVICWLSQSNSLTAFGELRTFQHLEKFVYCFSSAASFWDFCVMSGQVENFTFFLVKEISK